MQVVSHCVRVVRVSSQHGVGTGEPLQDVVVADSQEVGGLGGDKSSQHTLTDTLYTSSDTHLLNMHHYTLYPPTHNLSYPGIVGESIVYADVCQAWVALLTSNGSVFVLEYDVSDESLLLRYAGRRKDEENLTNGDDAMQIEKEGNVYLSIVRNLLF